MRRIAFDLGLRPRLLHAKSIHGSTNLFAANLQREARLALCGVAPAAKPPNLNTAHRGRAARPAATLEASANNGTAAPAVTLSASNSPAGSTSDPLARGASAPGCTLEACGFRDRWQTLQAAGAVVLGVSADTAASHQRFARLFKLPFPLLADPERRIIRAYHAQTPNPLLGWLGLGTRRMTYLIGPDGRILEVWPRVKAAGHAAEMLTALKRHQRRARAA
jgi:peroxiredoxin